MHRAAAVLLPEGRGSWHDSQDGGKQETEPARHQSIRHRKKMTTLRMGGAACSGGFEGVLQGLSWTTMAANSGGGDMRADKVEVSWDGGNRNGWFAFRAAKK